MVTGTVMTVLIRKKSLDNLNKHKDAAHISKPADIPLSENFSCNLCTYKYSEKGDLEKHRKQKHKTFKPCRNLPDCPYENNCIFNHQEVNKNMFLCYECGFEYKSLSDLMFHRKTHHNVNECIKFNENKCKFTDESCWYTHNEQQNIMNKDNKQQDTHKQGFWDPPSSSDPPTVQPSVFQVPPANLAPPSPQPTQATWLKMVAMMNNLNMMMKEMKDANQSQ